MIDSLNGPQYRRAHYTVAIRTKLCNFYLGSISYSSRTFKPGVSDYRTLRVIKNRSQTYSLSRFPKVVAGERKQKPVSELQDTVMPSLRHILPAVEPDFSALPLRETDYRSQKAGLIYQTSKYHTGRGTVNPFTPFVVCCFRASSLEY